jgi:hypothetical protein
VEIAASRLALVRAQVSPSPAAGIRRLGRPRAVVEPQRRSAAHLTAGHRLQQSQPVDGVADARLGVRPQAGAGLQRRHRTGVPERNRHGLGAFARPDQCGGVEEPQVVEAGGGEAGLRTAGRQMLVLTVSARLDRGVLSSTSSCGAPGPCLRCSASASATTSGIGMSRMLSAV